MTDPNLKKIINANLNDIKNNELALTLSHASSYLDQIYGYENRDKRIIELDNFIQEVKYLANKFRIKDNSNGVKNA